jgi:RNA polymerase sigma-70 factor (ECF subfamily)
LQDLEDIIQRCQQGNALAWETLIRQQQARVYGVACYFLRNPDEAKDATQEAFLKLYKGLKSFRGTGTDFTPWMLSIARNCCIDRLRRAQTRTRYEDQLKQTPMYSQHKDQNPEVQMGEDQRKQLIYQALDQFSELNREIILLKDIQGLKNEDVAQILSLPVGTIKSRSSRARLKLAQTISELSEDYQQEKLS